MFTPTQWPIAQVPGAQMPAPQQDRIRADFFARLPRIMALCHA